MRYMTVLRRPPSTNIADLLEQLTPRPSGETVIATGKLGSVLLHAIDRAGRPQTTTVLYASAGRTLTAAERSLAEALRQLGCSFGFVPHNEERIAGEGALVHGQA
jgi:hypothetical protein